MREKVRATTSEEPLPPLTVDVLYGQTLNCDNIRLIFDNFSSQQSSSVHP